MVSLETRYSARDLEARLLAAMRAAGLDSKQRQPPEERAALDHFHTGGLRASRELRELRAPVANRTASDPFGKVRIPLLATG